MLLSLLHFLEEHLPPRQLPYQQSYAITNATVPYLGGDNLTRTYPKPLRRLGGKNSSFHGANATQSNQVIDRSVRAMSCDLLHSPECKAVWREIILCYILPSFLLLISLTILALTIYAFWERIKRRIVQMLRRLRVLGQSPQQSDQELDLQDTEEYQRWEEAQRQPPATRLPRSNSPGSVITIRELDSTELQAEADEEGRRRPADRNLSSTDLEAAQTRNHQSNDADSPNDPRANRDSLETPSEGTKVQQHNREGASSTYRETSPGSDRMPQPSPGSSTSSDSRPTSHTDLQGPPRLRRKMGRDNLNEDGRQ